MDGGHAEGQAELPSSWHIKVVSSPDAHPPVPLGQQMHTFMRSDSLNKSWMVGEFDVSAPIDHAKFSYIVRDLGVHRRFTEDDPSEFVDLFLSLEFYFFLPAVTD